MKFISAVPSLLRGQRRRRVVAAVCLGIAVAIVAWIAVPRSAGTPVVVASKAVASGTELQAADLRITRYPAELVPDGASPDPAEFIGSITGAGLSQGAPVTAQALLTPANAAEGTLLVPVTVADEAAAAVLRPGHHVRIFATAGGDAQPKSPLGPGSSGALVDDAVVCAVSKNSGGGLAAGTSTVATLAVPAHRARALAASAGAGLGFALLN